MQRFYYLALLLTSLNLPVGAEPLTAGPKSFDLKVNKPQYGQITRQLQTEQQEFQRRFATKCHPDQTFVSTPTRSLSAGGPNAFSVDIMDLAKLVQGQPLAPPCKG